MITDETVFILGAGASAPYCYPTGNQLRRKIISEGVNLSFNVPTMVMTNIG